MDQIQLSGTELDLAREIARHDGITLREAISKAIFFLAHKVDYTRNIKPLEK